MEKDMGKLSNKRQQQEHGFAVTALRVVQEAMAGREARTPARRPYANKKNPHAVALGI